jgi:hypothetical protein
MTIGAAIFLVAVGAILRYAVSDSIEGVDLETIGLILMIAGVAGAILEFVRLSMWRRRTAEPVEREVVTREAPPRDRY